MTEVETWEAAAEQIRGWMRLNIEYFETTPFADPKESKREHKNTMSLLGTILSQFLKKAGHDPKDVFKELMEWSRD